MAHYKLSPVAHARLKDIRRFSIENWGKEQAKKYISGLREQMRQLAKSPKIGTNKPGLYKPIYCFSYVSHVIYYTITDYGIAVATILHKTMLPELHLKELRSGKLKFPSNIKTVAIIFTLVFTVFNIVGAKKPQLCTDGLG